MIVRDPVMAIAAVVLGLYWVITDLIKEPPPPPPPTCLYTVTVNGTSSQTWSKCKQTEQEVIDSFERVM